MMTKCSMHGTEYTGKLVLVELCVCYLILGWARNLFYKLVFPHGEKAMAWMATLYHVEMYRGVLLPHAHRPCGSGSDEPDKGPSISDSPEGK